MADGNPAAQDGKVNGRAARPRLLAPSAPAPLPRTLWHAWLAACLTVGALAAVAAGARTFVASLQVRAPAVLPVDPYAALFDHQPLVVSLHGMPGATWVTTAPELRHDEQLWRRMRLADWNAVPQPLREQALDAMLRAYSSVIADPRTWDRMAPADWDRVPHPVRTLAYRRMVAYWCGYYDLGGEYELPPTLVSDTVAAVVMSESWFDHRAVAASAEGGADVGLAQASPFARRRLAALHRAGVVDVSLADGQYFNPWAATRFAAIWMQLLLDESGGNLEGAVRAYHRGTARAWDPRGDAYAAQVQSRLVTFIRNDGAPASWDFVWRHGRRLFGPV